MTQSSASRSAATLPPTVNLHLVAHCNMKCRYCYAPFEEERREPLLAPESVCEILRQLAANGVQRVTFAGGEPTLHPDLGELLRQASAAGLVTAIVTNGSRITKEWLDTHGPNLRWLTLSIDSVVDATVVSLGRRTAAKPRAHLRQVLGVATLVHEFNVRRPHDRRIRLKMNITVTRLNSGEDPSLFVRACRPEKVKVLQMLLVEGENDDARDLVCSDESFETYATRLTPLERLGIEVVVENTEAMDGSYAMVDPLGRFFQRVNGRYAESQAIHDVGVMAAWESVGGFDGARFVARGGDYEPGAIARGNAPYWIAIEGLDGSGKSTIVADLAKQLGAVTITNPPASLMPERHDADMLDDDSRRAWYREANFEATRQARVALASGRTVVMDRSLASTLVFAAAERGRVACADEWPEELERPDLMLLLAVPEAERRRRLLARSDQLTAEERRLQEDAEFRQRVLAGYAAVGAWTVPAERAPEEVLRAILVLVRAGAGGRMQ